MASTDLAKLVVKLEAQNSQYLKKLDVSEKKVNRFRKQNKKALQGVSADFKKILGGVAIGVFVGKIVQATKKQEQAVAQLEAGLASTGGVVGRSLDELKAKADELQKATTFGDEDILQAQAQLLTFTKVTGDAFDKTIESALDLSARFGTDLKSSVLQLGKAMNDPVTQMSALSRSGITFTKTQTDMAKALVKNGDLLGAQKIILKELESQFGGSAEAARDTFGGALDGLSNAFGDLLEADGDGLNDAKKSIEDLTSLLQDPATKEGANQIASGIAKMAAAAASFATQGAGLIGFLRGEINENFLNFIDPDDLVRLDDKVVELNKEIAETASLLNKATAAQEQGFNQFGAIDTFKEKLKGLQEEAKTYEGLLAGAQKRVVTGGGDNKPDGGAGDKPAGTPAGTLSLVVPDTSGLDAAIAKEQDYIKTIRARGEALRQSVLSPNEIYAEQMVELNALRAEGAIGEETLTRKQLEYKAALDESTGVTAQYNEAQRILAEQIPALDAELQALADDQSLLNKAWLDGQITATQFASAMGLIDQKMVDLQDEAEKADETLSVFADQAARNIQDSLGSAINDLINGTEDWERAFIKSLLNIVAQAAAADLAGALNLSGSSGGNLAGLGNAVGSVFGGFFADGGRPDPNKISIVGERGPELLIPDGLRGEIVPAHKLNGGSSQSEPININAVTVLDANSILGVMGSPEMGSTFVNQAKINRSEFRAALGLTS